MIYLGTPGRMVGVKCPSSQRTTPAERYVFQTTLEGRVKAQVVPGQPRVWDIGFGDLTTPSQVAALMEFVQGAWGDGPFWFVPTEAPVTNLLSPATARLEANQLRGGVESYGGPMRIPGGWAPQSVLKGSGAVTFGDPLPVLPGGNVTGSVYVTGSGGRVSIRFLNIAGQVVSQSDSSGTASSTVERLFATSSVPDQAVAVELRVLGSITQMTRPALTWTDQVREYSDGNGCPKALVHQVSKSLVHIGVSGTFSSVNFAVTEVGV